MSKQGDNLLIGAGLILFGAIGSVLGFSDLHDEAGVPLVALGLPMMIGGIVMLIYLKKNSDQQSKEYLNRAFYALVKRNKGKITALEFATETNLNPAQARAFIEAKAIQLGSVPEIDEEGTIIYTFK